MEVGELGLLPGQMLKRSVVAIHQGRGVHMHKVAEHQAFLDEAFQVKNPRTTNDQCLRAQSFLSKRQVNSLLSIRTIGLHRSNQ